MGFGGSDRIKDPKGVVVSIRKSSKVGFASSIEEGYEVVCLSECNSYFAGQISSLSFRAVQSPHKMFIQYDKIATPSELDALVDTVSLLDAACFQVNFFSS